MVRMPSRIASVVRSARAQTSSLDDAERGDGGSRTDGVEGTLADLPRPAALAATGSIWFRMSAAAAAPPRCGDDLARMQKSGVILRAARSRDHRNP
jgi:hypothetical protein